MQNGHFREVLSTGPQSQVVVMCIPAGDEIGEETHDEVDQVLVFTGGEGEAILNGERSRVTAGRLVHVPAGTRHNFVNVGPDDLQLYTIYAPPGARPRHGSSHPSQTPMPPNRRIQPDGRSRFIETAHRRSKEPARRGR
jgi:mannose-6-phosphate isomerase-like protein (cupin superfamily)